MPSFIDFFNAWKLETRVWIVTKAEWGSTDCDVIVKISMVFSGAHQKWFCQGLYRHANDVWLFGALAWETFAAFSSGENLPERTFPYHDLSNHEVWTSCTVFLNSAWWWALLDNKLSKYSMTFAKECDTLSCKKPNAIFLKIFVWSL